MGAFDQIFIMSALRTLFRKSVLQNYVSFVQARNMAKGNPGDGAGQGGGSGGSIRDAGGSFGKMEQAQEEQFFRKLQQDQLKKMKTDTENQTTKDATDKDKEK